VAHGTSVHTAGKINNWRPTSECFRAHVEQVAKVSLPTGGRLGTTKTYVVTEPKNVPVASATAPAPAPAPAPKPVVKETPAPAPKPEPKVEAAKPALKPAPAEAWPRPEAPKSPLKPDAKPPIASTGSDDIMDLKRSKPTLKKP
jgi:hypothetical protein